MVAHYQPNVDFYKFLNNLRMWNHECIDNLSDDLAAAKNATSCYLIIN